MRMISSVKIGQEITDLNGLFIELIDSTLFRDIFNEINVGLNKTILERRG